MWLVRLMNNYSKECCGNETHMEILHSWIFRTQQEAEEFFAAHKANYGSRYSIGEWLDNPIEVKNGI
jgi:hypothetical protein